MPWLFSMAWFMAPSDGRDVGEEHREIVHGHAEVTAAAGYYRQLRTYQHDKLAQLGASLLIDTLPSIYNRTNKRIRQDETKATFASNILREDEKIDWNAKHVDVYNHIRGLHPWPGAYANLNNQRFKIWWAELDDTKYVDQTSGNPGEIIEIVNDESIKVICGNNRAINITEIQPAGKKRMSVSEFLLGNPNQLKVGQKLE